MDRWRRSAYHGDTMALRTGKLRGWLTALAVLLLAVAGGWLLAPGAGADYLQLQGQSDALHRGAVLAEPMLALSFVLLGLLALVFADFHWPRRILTTLTLAALAGGLGLGAYVVRFDLAIERAGTEGRFISRLPAGSPGPGTWAGPWKEDDGPGIATPPRPDGRFVELDRMSLSLKDAGGRRVWNRRRPGGWPASLLLGKEHLLLGLPSDRWEDDVVLQLIELASGRLVSEFHVLGRRIAVLAARGPRVSLATWRPSSTNFYVLDLTGPRVLWRRSNGQSPWPPRQWPEQLRRLVDSFP